jgi:HSP20 family protein
MLQVQPIRSAAVLNLTLVSQTMDFHMVLQKWGYIPNVSGRRMIRYPVKKANHMAKDEKKGKQVATAQPRQTLSPLEEMERLFENFYPRGWMRPLHTDWPSWSEMARSFEVKMPKVDVIDRDDEVVVRAEVPGVEKKDLDVSVTEQSITIKGETSHETKEEKGDYVRSEISQGTFSRTVSLPSTVDADKVKAEFKDGVLQLTMPKVERTKRRAIKID